MKTSAFSIQTKYSWIFVIWFIILNPDLAFAQNKNQTPSLEVEVNDLVVPNAPASAIIGSQINLKPAITPRTFGLSFLNSIANESGEFPNNIAVEFSPYWWSPRPELTFNDYYNKNGFGQFIRQSLSFSIASDASTVTTDNDEEIDVTKLGFGIRFALIAGRANPQVEDVKTELKNELQECLRLINKDNRNRTNTIVKKLYNDDELKEEDLEWLVETLEIHKSLYDFEVKQEENYEIYIDIIQSITKRSANNKDEKEEVKMTLADISELLSKLLPKIFDKKINSDDDKQMENFLSEINRPVGNERSAKCVQDNEEIDELNNKLNDLDKARVGLQLETASAVGFDFRENDFDEFRFRNFATWLTASYRGGGSTEEKKASSIEFLDAASYILYEFEDDTDSFSNIGAGLKSASAVGFDFLENDFDEFRFGNFTTWLTASYRGGGSAKENKASPIEFLGVARYTLDEFEDDTDSFFDIGAGIVYRLQKTPLAFSLEYIRRFGDDGDDRFVGVADYRINDTYSVFLSYGKDFEDEFEGNEDLVTLFGLKVGFGRNSTPTVSVPK